MKMRLTKRSIGWGLASLVLVGTAGGLLLVLLDLGSHPCDAAMMHDGAKPGQGDDQPAASAARPTRVKTVRPTREHLKRVTTQPAHVDPYEKTDIFAKVSGYLKHLGQVRDGQGEMRAVDIGDRVERDQVLAELSIPELKQDQVQKEALVEQAQSAVSQAAAALLAAEAMVEVAQAQVEEARSQIAKYDADALYRQGEYARLLRFSKESGLQKDVVEEKLLQLRSAEASVTAAQAALATAQANVKVEQAKAAKARADVASAQAHVKVARANREHAAIWLNYGRIRAPYRGVITRRLVDCGVFVQSATTGRSEPLFTIMRVDPLRIVTDIPESDSAWVKLGQPATLQVDAPRGQQFTGKVARFADALDPATRTMRTEVELDAPAKELRPGMFGSVVIRFADFPDALLLPTSALAISGPKPAVWIVDAGKARRREIELGYNDGIRMQITRGLSGEEAIITDGKNLVREGQPVEVAR